MTHFWSETFLLANLPPLVERIVNRVYGFTEKKRGIEKKDKKPNFPPRSSFQRVEALIFLTS